MEENVADTQDKKVQEEKSGSSGRSSLKLVIGIIFVLLGVIALANWFGELIMVIKGCIGLFLIMAGAITIAIAKE